MTRSLFLWVNLPNDVVCPRLRLSRLAIPALVQVNTAKRVVGEGSELVVGTDVLDLDSSPAFSEEQSHASPRPEPTAWVFSLAHPQTRRSWSTAGRGHDSRSGLSLYPGATPRGRAGNYFAHPQTGAIPGV